MNEILAKKNPNKTLISHMFETGLTTYILLTKTIYRSLVSWFSYAFDLNYDNTRNLLCYLSAIHDIGKCHEKFQEKLTNNTIHFRHEYESKEFFEKYWEHIPQKIRLFFGNVLAMHHYKYKENNIIYYDNEKKNEIYQLECDFNKKILSVYNPVFPENIKNIDAVGCILLGLIVISDWIASSIADNKEDYAQRVIKFVTDAGLTAEPITPKPYSELWPFIKNPSPTQQAIETLVKTRNELPLLTIIEDSTGSGKTEAAIYLAQYLAVHFEKYGNYIALPTGTTASAICKRYNEVLEKTGTRKSRLVYGGAWLQTDSPAFLNESDFWFSPSRLALIQRDGVGTVDQVMMAVMPKRFSLLRLFGLTSKVLIIDEVHAYDWYMQGILEILLNYCKVCKIPVIILSATLPEKKKRHLLNAYLKDEEIPEINSHYPLITTVYAKSHKVEQIEIPVKEKKNYEVKLTSKQSAIKIIEEGVRKGGCWFYIADTVKSSKEVFLQLKDRLKDENIEIILFNSNFSALRRKEIEEKCIKLFGKDKSNRPAKAILVATQVVEQSLDIDADVIISEPAGMDLIIQRMGREWRHQSERPRHIKKPIFYMINDTTLCRFVYNKNSVLVENTLSYFSKYHEICLPDNIRTAIKETTPEEDSDDMLIAQDDLFNGEFAAFPKPGNKRTRIFTDSWLDAYTEKENEEINETRQGDNTIKVAVLPYSLYEKFVNKKPTMKVVREVFEYSCNVRYKEWMDEYTDNEFNILCFPANKENKYFKANETGTAYINNGYIKMDKDMGYDVRT